MDGLILLLGFAALVLVTGGPLYLMMGRIHRRANATRVSATGALVLAFVGYLLGIVLTEFAVFRLLDVADAYGKLPTVMIFPALLLGSAVGSAVGSIGSYIWIWYRTSHDADYDDQLKVSSHITHIPQSRDGDDVVSE